MSWVVSTMVTPRPRSSRTRSQTNRRACGRLVEEQHLGLVHQRPGDHQPLRHAARVDVHLVVAAVAQPELLQHPVRPGAPLGARHQVVGGVEDQVLAGGQRPVQVDPLRHHRQPPPRLDRVAQHVDPGDPGSAGGGHHPGREDPHRGGLAGTVGPQQAEDLAPGDLERQPVDRVRLPFRVALDQLPHDHRAGLFWAHCHPTASFQVIVPANQMVPPLGIAASMHLARRSAATAGPAPASAGALQSRP
jgi:hypothetical protein